MTVKLSKTLILILLLLATVTTACGSQPADQAPASGQAGDIKLMLAAYTTPREAYAEIIPLFQAYWKEKTGQNVIFEESYLGSGAQSRAVVEGFEADVVALSLEADVTRIQDAGLIRTLPFPAFSHCSRKIIAPSKETVLRMQRSTSPANTAARLVLVSSTVL